MATAIIHIACLMLIKPRVSVRTISPSFSHEISLIKANSMLINVMGGRPLLILQGHEHRIGGSDFGMGRGILGTEKSACIVRF